MNEDQQGITADDVIVDFGERVRRGYDPAAVDAHLQRIARGVADLQNRSESGDGDESLELVLKATRRSVEEALAEARERANRILDDAAVRAASTVAAARSAPWIGLIRRVPSPIRKAVPRRAMERKSSMSEK